MLPARDVPSTLRLTFYDPANDYQTGEARAIAGAQGTNERQHDLPAVLGADAAKTLANQMIAREWADREKLKLRLPPARMLLQPGSIVDPGIGAQAWIVEKSTIDGFVTVVELRPAIHPVATLAADSGRIVASADIVAAPTSLALIDARSPIDPQGSAPTIQIAASSPNAGWSAHSVTITSSGQSFATQTPVRKSVLGQALSALADAEPFLIDNVNSVDIELVDRQQWITSCDDNALADGANLAIVGSEILQFADVALLGDGCYRLSRLLRGRGGTEWATADHAAGDLFCLFDANSLRSCPLPPWMRGATVTATDRSGSTASLTFGAESVRPLSPISLAASFDESGNLVASWTRRSRSSFAWLDEVDAPVGESREQYSIAITGQDGSLDLASEQPTIVVAASELSQLGTGSTTFEVRQVGDWAASRPAQLTIEL